MKLTKCISLFVLILIFTPCFSQEEEAHIHGETDYRIEMFGSAASGEHTPFWMVSNRYGLVPLDANNGYMRIGTFHQQDLGNKFHWSAGLDVAAAFPRYKNVYLQQIYAEIGYGCLALSVGSKENYTSLWDRELSSGDMVISANARPIPELNISVSQFTIIPFTKGWLQFKGNFAVGRSFDDAFLEQFINDKQIYTKNVLWHNKSLYLRLLDTRNDFPLMAVIGVRHYAQWGGTSSNQEIGKQPQSLKDFLRIIIGHSGGGDATLSDQINVLGNHYGSYDIKLGYIGQLFSIHAYKQHYYEDKSGMELYNFADGLYGLQANLHSFSLINKLVLEFLNTRNQSGPFHYLWFDHSLFPGYGGGGDDYYNNGEYQTGVSYFNRSLGSPLLTSPEYNNDGSLGFKNNRVRYFHLGFEGILSNQVVYRLLATSSENWGTMGRPFLKKKNGYSCDVKISYCHPRLTGWKFSGEVSTDLGSMYGDNIGFGLSVAKTGILKFWK